MRADPSHSSAVPWNSSACSCGGRLQCGDAGAGLLFAERERVVGAEHDAGRRQPRRAGSAGPRSSCTQESKNSRSRYSRGLRALSVATRSGRMRKPCSMRPIVYGNAPPPWAKHTRSFGRRSSTPPKIRQQAARDCSAGMPTSHGSQYFGMVSRPIMSHGCTRIAAPRSAAASKNGNSSGASRFQSIPRANRSARPAGRVGRCSVPSPGSPASATAAARCRCRRSGAGDRGRFRRCGR